MRISDWSSDVCSSDLRAARRDDRVGADPDRRDERAVRSDEGALADLGPIFEIAVVIAGDRTRADIRGGADGDIAQIGQMVRLRALADHRILGLDEIADLCLFAEYRARTQPREGTDIAPRAEGRALDMAVGATLHPVRDRHPRAEKDIGFDFHVAADISFPVDPDGL